MNFLKNILIDRKLSDHGLKISLIKFANVMKRPIDVSGFSAIIRKSLDNVSKPLDNVSKPLPKQLVI